MKDLPPSPDETVTEQAAVADVRAEVLYRLRTTWPSRSTWIAVAAGVFVAAIFIAWPAIAGRKRALKEDPEPAQAAVSKAAIGHQTELPEPLATPRVRLRQSLAADPVETTMLDYAASANMPESPNAELPAEQFAPVEDPRQQAIMLSADDPALDFGLLSTGQTVRGDPQRRPAIEVPPGGFVVAADSVTFENIDFVATAPLSAGAAMVTLQESHVVFDGCSFATETEISASLPPAIAWVCEVADSPALEVRNSSFQNVSAAIGLRVSGIASCRIENVLHLGPGTLIALDRPPESGESVILSLSHVTARGAEAVVTIGCQRLPGGLGRLDVQASDCAFALRSAAALVVYDSAIRPGPLLAGLRWTGRGSVVSGRTRRAMWRTPEGRLLATRDEAAPITGVARGEITFAGTVDEGWAGSQVVPGDAVPDSWQRPGIQ